MGNVYTTPPMRLVYSRWRSADLPDTPGSHISEPCHLPALAGRSWAVAPPWTELDLSMVAHRIMELSNGAKSTRRSNMAKPRSLHRAPAPPRPPTANE
ncbi:hypothetical protein GGTG_03350 [Gaeumannomyces tritici R3-111a-1]|uniref:Uncharacterized protein n=1 Tax=Gaeumannomyces tritici (strain R3-111a-1) TaxID=644352 RepID=J3NPZ2_GAET3|nr:hypothetical protein GGTG_03350 [Gaeumannomyces tritici R3-111a-1]EJT78248.1 hypothetical protein GGTG_03350 [Gaeumannomyces tritici R3-111a-1]